MSPTRIAALLTCHNRRDTTVAHLTSLLSQALPGGVALSVFVVDDASTDGTANAVRGAFPAARVIEGTGKLYWNGGMRLAYATACREHFDSYLWLNDDTVLDPGAIVTLLATASKTAAAGAAGAIVVGSTRDPGTGAVTYGGVVRASRWHPLRFRLVAPADRPLPCDTMNGNCVLIPADTARALGSLDPAFTHSIGDFDYGLRARSAGFSVWVAPGFVGTCARHHLRGGWEDPELPLAERWRRVNDPKGLPVREWRTFARRHGGPIGSLLWVIPYLRLLLAPALGRRRPPRAQGG